MVTAALTLALGAYFLTMVHRLEFYEPKFNRTDYSHIVVAGAWRLPNKTLSATFARRVDRGDELAQQFNATLVFTGGLGDSRAAKKYSAYGGPTLYEDKSRTTLQNAIETARVAPDATSILVVSSPYHLGRCLVYFQRAFPTSVVDVAAALPDKRNDGSCGRFFEGFYWAKTCALGLPYADRVESSGRVDGGGVTPSGPRTSGSIRELGAWAKNIIQGHLSFREDDAIDFLKRLDLKKKGVT